MGRQIQGSRVGALKDQAAFLGAKGKDQLLGQEGLSCQQPRVAWFWISALRATSCTQPLSQHVCTCVWPLTIGVTPAGHHFCLSFPLFR